MKNSLVNVNDHLVAQMERLRDESLSADALEAEIRRSAALAGVAARTGVFRLPVELRRTALARIALEVLARRRGREELRA